MTDHKSFVPILLLVWTFVALLLGAALLSMQNNETNTAAMPEASHHQASAPLPPVRPTTVLTEPPPAPVLSARSPAATTPPPNKTQTAQKPFPILEFIAIQIAFLIFTVCYIRARFKTHLNFLLKHHPTLGNFTNVKYTHIRFISTGDLLFLLFTYNTMLIILYTFKM